MVPPCWSGAAYARRLMLPAIGAALLGWLGFAAPPANAQDTPPLNQTYTALSQAVGSATLPLSVRQTLQTRVASAAQAFNFGSQTPRAKAVAFLGAGRSLLGGSSTQLMPSQERKTLQYAFDAALAQTQITPPPDKGRLNLVLSDTSGKPAARAQVRINGVFMGVADLSGRFSIDVPAGDVSVSAVIYPGEAGEQTVSVAPGQSRNAALTLQEGAEVAEPAALYCREYPNALLDTGFPRLTFYMADGGAAKPLKTLGSVSIENAITGQSFEFIDNLFVVDRTGQIVAQNLPLLRQKIQARQGFPIRIKVDGLDAQGRVYSGSIDLSVGQFRVTGKLAPSPTFPGLRTGGVALTARVLNSQVVVNLLTAPDGSFVLPKMPSGTLTIHAETLQNFRYYYADTIVVVSSSRVVSVPLLSVQDFSLPSPASNLGLSDAPPASTDPRRLQLHQKFNGSGSLGPQTGFGGGVLNAASNPPPAGGDTGGSTATVTGGPQNVVNSAQASLLVPKGTKKIVLEYTVSTQEYPTYVLSQSQYNDTWSVRVNSGTTGQQAFNLFRQVNSQLVTPPVWQVDGSTGLITAQIDVAALAAASDTPITVTVTSQNIGDGILPTTVTATLKLDNEFSIVSVVPEDAVSNGQAPGGAVVSIPRPQKNNVYHRTLLVKLTRPAGATVSKAKVTLLSKSGATLQQIRDDAPGNAAVTVLTETTNEVNLRMRVTFDAAASTVSGTPPAADKIKYRVTLTGDKDGSPLTAEKESGELVALWRMPNGIARFGPFGTSPEETGRDAGLDDWSALSTYNFIAANRTLLPAINDVSGEHGRDIGHAEHKLGNDMDCYHFPGITTAAGVNGAGYYNALLVQTAAALNGSEPARLQVAAWVSNTRTGIDQIAAKGEVQKILYGFGKAGGGLPAGWMKTVLSTGKITVGTKSAVFSTSSWSNAKHNYRTQQDHNDHIHVGLYPTP